MIFIGSTAINHWLPGFRKPKDKDLATTCPVVGYDCIILPLYILREIPYVDGVATLDAVYTLKLSHLPYDIKWNKHKSDALYLKAKGCKIVEPLYTLLQEHWLKEHGNKPHLSLYQNKDDFFNDHVPYVYDHDYLHELVAYPNKPVYNECLKDGQDVLIDKEKFFSMPRERQLRMFKEEISVIAAERWLINPKVCGKYTWMGAYHLALHKTVVSLTKGWASRFIVENLEYYNVPEYEYFEHLLLTLKECEKIMANQLTYEEKQSLVYEIALEYNIQCVDDIYYRPYDLDDIDTESLWSEVVKYGKTGVVESLEQHGGEGAGDSYWIIFEFKGELYKASTWYQSNRGVGWGDIEVYKVKAVKKRVTVYE